MAATHSQPAVVCEAGSPDPSPPVGRKKALLIGICGSKTASEDYPELRGSHNDVKSVHDLLVDCYSYKSADITILIDDGIPGHVQPTRVNILEAIKTFVKDAKAGDHFCFHYCGHSTQTVNRSNTEEDGMDECIIPCDGVDKKIVDNELKAALVTPLPSGSYLVAVLDTCHSGTLLDLKHSKCNQVIVPWVQRGKRASGDFRDRVVRKNARIASPSHTALSIAKPKVNPPSRRSSRFPAQQKDNRGTEAGCTFTYCSRTVSFASPETENDVRLPDGAANTDVDSAITPSKFFPEGYQRCQSPVAMFECNGWCRDAVAAERASDGVDADVVSLASCKDSELTYEDMNGKSMTASLVEILRRDPHQPVKDVLLSVSHAMYKKSSIRHKNSREYKKKCKEFAVGINKRLAQLSGDKPLPQTTRSMSLVMPEPPTPRLAPSPTFPAPRQRSFFARRMDDIKRLKDDIKRLKEVKVLESWLESIKNVECDTHLIPHPELASARPLDMNRQWKM
ncbi:caspase domain-containing protein [Mycena capillaripes]|nr:caspase domain-containing protein [Mycena capillaripes]